MKRTDAPRRIPAEERQERLAAALRENLRKRKDQARQRSAGEPGAAGADGPADRQSRD